MSETMQAMVIERYGSPEVLKLAEVPKPKPKRGEVLVRIRAIGTNPKDAMVRKGKFRVLTGNKFPKIIGHDIAGEVVEAAPGADLKVGERVYGMINDFSGRAYAEFAAVRADNLARIPNTLDWQQAAAIPLAAQTALQAVRDSGKLKTGQRVLINGASGGVGVFAIQIAKILGAHITATSSARNRELCLELGADEHVDYQTCALPEIEGRFDVIFDVFGNYHFGPIQRLLTPRGIYVHTLPNKKVFKDVLWTCFRQQRAKLVLVTSRRRQLEWINREIECGTFKAVIDRSFAFKDVAEAHRYLETKRAKGKVVLAVG